MVTYAEEALTEEVSEEDLDSLKEQWMEKMIWSFKFDW